MYFYIYFNKKKLLLFTTKKKKEKSTIHSHFHVKPTNVNGTPPLLLNYKALLYNSSKYKKKSNLIQIVVIDKSASKVNEL